MIESISEKQWHHINATYSPDVVSDDRYEFTRIREWEYVNNGRIVFSVTERMNRDGNYTWFFDGPDAIYNEAANRTM